MDIDAHSRAGAWFVRVHFVLTAAISLSVAGLALLYRYVSGEWSPSGVVLSVLLIGAGSTAWWLMPRDKRNEPEA